MPGLGVAIVLGEDIDLYVASTFGRALDSAGCAKLLSPQGNRIPPRKVSITKMTFTIRTSFFKDCFKYMDLATSSHLRINSCKELTEMYSASLVQAVEKIGFNLLINSPGTTF